ncbi:hypothetical protein SYK_06930 [Pseudodesulfovibrio nedwellii]|uniref:DUF4325 domain-containing protein n=1 Tax=Pseudodesulfovibrio nedwellii TaxID=2973072 RepID=A0ABM8AXZ2_9BACT|nr:hypothetical protein [Pseudodesulfovibrio nedwellii]BDQ36333.1 hypothetical protein SYK_06930 [Pseudodesulfovibrio nedwellii]
MNQKINQTIDFGNFGSSLLTTRERGELAGKKLRIDEMSCQGNPIKIIVPDYITSITSSFILGMFGNIIQRCGSEEAFLKKFQFQMKDRHWINLNRSIEYALRPTNCRPY